MTKTFQMDVPKGKSMGVIGRVESTSPLLVTLDSLENGRQSEKLRVKVDKAKRSVEVKARYDTGTLQNTSKNVNVYLSY